jgi:cyanocobalamin reductase (cyanide-eliminating) / alkylcobalamin dealkylase
MPKADWSSIVDTLRASAAVVGLDIVHAFPVAGFARPCALGLVIGNTRALWTPFVAAVNADAELAAAADPLERYLETRLPALIRAATDRAHSIEWAHRIEPRIVPIQRIAEQAGLASLAPSHLSIHPEHGPWFALRAVVVVDVDGPEAPTPALESPCERCSKPCLPALERALAATGPEADAGAIARNAEAWIAIRDACPVGKASRYGSEQLRYHYVKDRSLLRRPP